MCPRAVYRFAAIARWRKPRAQRQKRLLSPNDYAACVQVVKRDDFEDNQWANVLGIPTITAFAQTEKILPQDHGYHAISADFVLNVAMHLAGVRVRELVARYHVVRNA